MKLPAIRQLPSGSWFCRVRIDGKDVCITEPSEAKCRARAMAYKTGIIDERRAPSGAKTLAQACDQYIDIRRGVIEPSTIATYEKYRRLYFQGIMSTRLSALNDHLLSQAVSCERQKTSRRGRPISAKTIQSALGFIKCVLKENKVEYDKILAPEVKRRVVRLPEPDRVIRAIVGSEIELPCMLAAWLSLSMSEIRGLTKSRSVYNHQLYVVDTVVRVRVGERTTPDGKKKGIYQDIKKEGGKEEERTRVLDLPPYIESLIAQVEGDVLCPLTVRQIERRFNALVASAGLPHMTFHQLRHLNASTMAMLQIQKEIARERGGWKTDHVMNQVYTHTFDTPRLEADKKINAFFEKQISSARPHPQPETVAEKLRNGNKSAMNLKKHKVYRLFRE